MILVKLAPALTLGNTCIIKPPSIDSLAALKLAELLEKLNYRREQSMSSPVPAARSGNH